MNPLRPIRPLRPILPTPCSVDWDTMTGDDRVRRCPSCTKDVYNVTLLTRGELDRLLVGPKGALPCVRAYRRPDGTIVTRDCMVRVRRAARWVRLRAAVVVGFLFALWSDVAVADARPSAVPSSQAAAAAPSTAPPAKPKKPSKPPRP